MAPARPPIRPETIIVLTSVAGTSIPTARLKRGFAPTIRDRRPAAVNRSQRPNSATSARLMTNPRCSVVGGNRRGSSAPAPIGSVAELAEPRARNGPLTSQLVMSTAMKFNIRVVTTSSTPRLVRASAGPINQTPPTIAAAPSAIGISSIEGQPVMTYPRTAATSPPR